MKTSNLFIAQQCDQAGETAALEQCIASGQVSAAQIEAHRVLDAACSEHPDAPHGFMRNESHSAHRYVCECEGWEPSVITPPWKVGNEYLPYDPHAAHVDHDYRDGWNACYESAITNAAPRGTDAQILKEREITTSAIVGAMAYGFQNSEYPPDDSAWLRPFWEMGRRDAERDAAIAQPKDKP